MRSGWGSTDTMNFALVALLLSRGAFTEHNRGSITVRSGVIK